VSQLIEHVFVLMLENRSFDHMLGFSSLAGTDAVSGEPTTVEGLTGGETNRLPSGEEIAASAGADFSLTVDPPHNFEDVLEQLCGQGATYPDAAGRYPPITMSGFASRLAASSSGGDPSAVMRAFRPGQLPVINALAAEFAVCDHWFSSLPGPTWPNRCFVHAASSAGLDDSPTMARSATALLDGYKFASGTIFDKLSAAGVPWSVAEGDALPQVLSLSGMLEHVLEGRFFSIKDFAARVNDPAFADAYVFIEPHYGHVLADGRNFKCGNSQHPLDDVTRGEKLLKDVYETIRNSPLWESSLLIVLYDEHGGFYDHVVPPPAPPPGDPFSPDNNRHGFQFDQLGVRIPTLVISPYTTRGAIDHSVHDHTSVLATVERLHGLDPLTARDASAPGLEHLFALDSPRQDAPTRLPGPAPSGIPDCGPDLDEQLLGVLERVPAELAGPVDSTLVGFLQVAMARELHLAAAAKRDLGSAIDQEKDRLLSTYEQIHTKFDAVKFLRDVQAKYNAANRR
jgi:phospholipase C